MVRFLFSSVILLFFNTVIVATVTLDRPAAPADISLTLVDCRLLERFSLFPFELTLRFPLSARSHAARHNCFAIRTFDEIRVPTGKRCTFRLTSFSRLHDQRPAVASLRGLFPFFFIRQTVPAMPQHTTASVAHKGLRTPRKNEFIEVSELCSACASLLPFSLHPLCEKRKLLEDINAAFTRMVVKEGRVDWAQGLNILESS